jgi:hypothetical protein
MPAWNVIGQILSLYIYIYVCVCVCDVYGVCAAFYVARVTSLRFVLQGGNKKFSRPHVESRNSKLLQPSILALPGKVLKDVFSFQMSARAACYPRAKG